MSPPIGPPSTLPHLASRPTCACGRPLDGPVPPAVATRARQLLPARQRRRHRHLQPLLPDGGGDKSGTRKARQDGKRDGRAETQGCGLGLRFQECRTRGRSHPDQGEEKAHPRSRKNADKRGPHSNPRAYMSAKSRNKTRCCALGKTHGTTCWRTLERLVQYRRREEQPHNVQSRLRNQRMRTPCSSPTQKWPS